MPTTVLRGIRGACACGHPLGVAAAHEAALAGGTAADMAVAAAAVLAVVLPEACGLGGEAMALVARSGEPVAAFNGVGAAPAALPEGATIPRDGGGTVAVPAAVAAWTDLLAAHGRLEPAQALGPAIRLARDGWPLASGTAQALREQRARLERGAAQTCGAGTRDDAPYALLRAGLRAGERVRLPGLAEALEIAAAGDFYAGPVAEAIVATARGDGSLLTAEDLATHRTHHGPALRAGRLAVSPPSSQAALLPAALAVLDAPPQLSGVDRLHALIEGLDAAFAHRHTLTDDAGAAALLARPLPIDLERAGRRGGTRAYTHTTAITCADADGTLLAMLASVFDDFGAALVVPGYDVVLNSRLLGFTQVPNAPGPGRVPVSTLAPVVAETGDGRLALATPGADGQVQTLAQVLEALASGADLGAALAAPRFRLQEDALLVEDGLAADALAARGHAVVPRPAGDDIFGAVTAAGVQDDGTLVAAADPRRETWALAW